MKTIPSPVPSVSIDALEVVRDLTLPPGLVGVPPDELRVDFDSRRIDAATHEFCLTISKPCP